MSRFPASVLMLAVMCGVGGVMGCHRKPVKVEQPATEPPGARSAWAVRLPTVTQTLGEVRAEMARLDRFSPEFDEARLKMAILQDGHRKANGVEGFDQRESWSAFYNSPTVAADSATRRVAWRALTCFNPACRAVGRGGGPFLFTREYSWVTLDRNNELRVGTANDAEMRQPCLCPACGSGDYIRHYELPQAMVRERELMEELRKANEAYAEAVVKRRSIPKGVRTPKEITQEMESLPRLYLLSEPGKTKRFDGIIGPARTTPDGTP